MPVNPAFIYRCDAPECLANVIFDQLPPIWTEDTTAEPTKYYCQNHSQQQ